MQITEFWTHRSRLRETKIVQRESVALNDGECRLAIDKFALTANNVSYATSGEAIGYWRYFPAEGEWGKVPVWGFADVLESRCPGLLVGERIWGFFPMASHVTMQPARLSAGNFFDMAAHRQDLPRLYNQYYRTAGEPAALRAMEDERCLLYPLFATSFIIYDSLLDNDFFGADQVVIASASSKTAFGLAHLLHHDADVRRLGKRVIGLTSPGKIDFVQSLGVCDQVLGYDQVEQIDPSVKTAFVDMSGNRELVARVHRHVGENIVDSAMVGATHWEHTRKGNPLPDAKDVSLPGARPAFFFAPTRFAKREKDWGPGVVTARAFDATQRIAASLKGQIQVVHRSGPDAVVQSYAEVIDNTLPPAVGLMLSLR